MKTRWSLSFTPLWSSANKRSSSHPSSLSHRWSTLSTLTLWSLVLSLFCLVVPSLSHPYPFLYQRGNRHAYARNIRPLPCQAKGGDTGVCMFAWDCMKANGTHLGTCIDRFYFGSCCKLDSIKRPIKPVQVTGGVTNVIPNTPSTKPSTVKPSPNKNPEMTESGTTVQGTDKPDMTGSGTTVQATDTPDMTGSGITVQGTDKPDMTGSGTTVQVTDKPDMTGSGTTAQATDKPDITGSGTTVQVTDKPGMTGSGTTVQGTDKPDMTGSGTTVQGTDKPDMTGSGTTVQGTDKPDMTGSGTTVQGTDKPDMTGSGTTVQATDKPDMTGSGTTVQATDKPDMTGSGTTVQATDKPDMTGSGTTVQATDKPDMTASKPNKEGMTDIEDSDVGTDIFIPQLTGLGTTESDMIKPVIIDTGITLTVDKGTQVTENDLSGIIGTGDVNLTDSSIEVEVDTATGSTVIVIEPNMQVSEDNEDFDKEFGIDDATESTGINGDGDNLIPNGVIGENLINGDSAIIADDDPLLVDESPESSTELAGSPEIKPATPIKPPSTDSPFEETMLPQEPVTTFSPVKQPSKPDENKDDDPSIGITVIPSAGKPVKPNDGEKVNDEDDIELTTFLTPVTDKIADEANIEDETESIFTDIGSIATEPSVITFKPKPTVSKPDIETVTEIPPEDSTVLGQLPGFPGIIVIPAAITPDVGDAIKSTSKPVIEVTTEINKPEPSTDKINIVEEFPDLIIIPTTTESEKPSTNIPVVSIKPTTEADPIIKFPVVSINPTTEAEMIFDPINIEEFPDLIIIPTTTESEKPSTNFPVVSIEPTTEADPIIKFPVVSIKPTPKPNPPVTDGGWVPFRPTGYPESTENPKPTKKPIDTQVETEDPLIVAESTTIPSIVDILNSSKYSDICGRPVYPTKRIVGGSDASFGEFPWQVSLRQWRSVTFLHKCGAALLNENWAVTAAHCVENVQPEQLLLRLGEFDLETADEPYGFVERKVQIIATHPQFDARTFEYDLALLRFYEPINFQPNVIPICIPQDDHNYIGETGFVSGWGRLYEDGPLPSIMQKVPVPVITNQDCESMYKVAGYVEHIPQIFICAGYEAGLKDSCEGDSGGPMVIQRDGVWNLAGVISWGIGCALPNQPGVYTRISAFREWIEKIIVF